MLTKIKTIDTSEISCGQKTKKSMHTKRLVRCEFMLFVIATNLSGGGPGRIFLLLLNPKLAPLNSLTCSSLLVILLSPVFVPCTNSPVAPVLDIGDEPSSTLEEIECIIWGAVDGGGDERRETSADAATVASSLNVKLSFTKSDKFLAEIEKCDILGPA